MSVKPILFNTEMVKAILEGRKSCTRRLVKTRRKDACGFYVTRRKADGLFAGIYEYDENESMFDNQLEPPYQPGDIMYVRETWDRFECWNCDGDERGNCPKEPKKSVLDKTCGCYMYRATDEISGDAKWHPSIHMPKEAARIFLRVTNVRVERLQDITEEQACMEGTDPWDEACYENNGWHPTFSDPDSGGDPNMIEGFHKLWNSTIKKTDLDRNGWNANPWVWVIEFEKCEKPESEE